MWLTCSGSLIPNLLAPDDAGIDAAWGTVAHELSEQQLKTGHHAVERLGEQVFVPNHEWGFMITIDAEMLTYVQIAVDYCEWLPGDHFVEQRVFFSEYTPLNNQSGTADHCACEPGIMTITDHKFGKGVKVYAAENTDDPRSVIIDSITDRFKLNGNSQALLYALGFFLKYDEIYRFERIIIRISQPRLDHWDEWETTREELLKFAEWAKVRAYAAWRPDAPRHPSAKGCRWCKVSGTCAAYAVMEESFMSAAFHDLIEDIGVDQMTDLKERLSDPIDGYTMAVKNVTELSIEDMATLYQYRSVSERFWKKLAERLHQHALDGGKVPGYKMVDGRSIRVIADEKQYIQRLVDHGVPMSKIIKKAVVSPAQAEDLLVEAGVRVKDIPDVFADVVRKPKGQPTLASERDKRPAVQDLSEEAFADLVKP